MTNFLRRRSLADIFRNERPKSPWGNGPANGDGGNGDGEGPRNPWGQAAGPREPGRGSATIEDIFQRARGGGGGGNGGGGMGGMGGMPNLPNLGGKRLWALVIGGLLLVWILFTSIHQIGPRERGVVTLLGKYSATLEPGFRLSMPAPIAVVEVIDVENINTENFPQSGENLMLTGDQNIVDLAYSVRWNIRSAPDFAFQIAKPRETVRAVAETAMRAAVATASLNDTIGAGRARIEGEVQNMMQQLLDEYNSGIRIQGVAIQKAAAPQAVDEDFKLVSAAQQEAQSNKNNANAYAQQVIAAAQGEAAEFDKIYEQYKAAPEVTRRRLYYETMEAVLGRSNKTIVEAPGVTPYLALPELGRKAAPAPAAPQQGAAQ